MSQEFDLWNTFNGDVIIEDNGFILVLRDLF
jgi:hypothetical protein